MPPIHPMFADLSHYDDLQDIEKFKAAGFRGIVNKATEGPGMVDRTFGIRRPVALKAGIRYGAYHFLRPGNMQQQAEHFLNTIIDVTDLLLALDFEVKNISIEHVKEWMQVVHAKVGRWPVLYSYSAMLVQMLGTRKPDPFLAASRLWIAAYNTHPQWPTQIWPTYWAWQFTGDGNGPGPHTIPGVVLPGSRGLDVDSYEGGDPHFTGGTEAEFNAEWAS